MYSSPRISRPSERRTDAGHVRPQITAFIDPFFQDNLNDAAVAHIIRGAYHSARPAASSGAAQAQYFMTYGTGWSPNGISLPGAIYLEGILPTHVCGVLCSCIS